jgi:hypothetical protein
MLQCMFTLILTTMFGIVATIIYTTCEVVETHILWLIHVMVNLCESLELTHSMLMFIVFNYWEILFFCLPVVSPCKTVNRRECIENHYRQVFCWLVHYSVFTSNDVQLLYWYCVSSLVFQPSSEPQCQFRCHLTTVHCFLSCLFECTSALMWTHLH